MYFSMCTELKFFTRYCLIRSELIARSNGWRRIENRLDEGRRLYFYVPVEFTLQIV